ncbi:hypothetical protein TSUD_327720 [Trifolium subterraneum]|uniref:Replication factor A C-terminal domain-containing protein n=1 Tax=Trifolium subterraneum TaxID=3900 RepID=A0A2Z6LWU5_TRISU|nr:hypothetical protein TSUD_327720 [Trifolium subterraneum]
MEQEEMEREGDEDTSKVRRPAWVNPYEGKPEPKKFPGGPSDKTVLLEYRSTPHIARCVLASIRNILINSLMISDKVPNGFRIYRELESAYTLTFLPNQGGPDSTVYKLGFHLLYVASIENRRVIVGFGEMVKIESIKFDAKFIDVADIDAGVSSEREYVHDGKMIKMIVLELTDPRLDISGISTSSPVPIIGPRARPSFEDDLLNLYPKKTIKELESLMEEGIFVVCVVIDGFVDVALSNWWYLACKWHRIATPDSGAHYCKGCDKHVYVTIPRFKVKANVFDGETNVVFVIFDGDMQYLIQKECPSLVVSVQGENRGIYPTEFEDLKGVKLLFKSNVVSPIKEIKKTVYSPTRVDEFASGLFESSEALKFAEENLVTPDCDVVDNSTDDCSFDVIIVDDDDSDINVGMSAVKRKAQEGQYWTQRRT